MMGRFIDNLCGCNFILLRYAECYPGLAEMDDAMGDSDDEVLEKI